MERTTRIQQLYGYTVCLVAVIVLLIQLSSFIDAFFDRAHPLDNTRVMTRGPERLSSFEAYRASLRNSPNGPVTTTENGKVIRPDTLTDAEMRSQYAAVRADAIESSLNETSKRMVTSALLMILAIVLFGTHWRWLTRTVNVRANAAQTDVPA